MTRKYHIVLRRIHTGCDYHVRIWLKGPEVAFERACKYVPRAERNGLRLVSCVVDQDQTKPDGEIK